METTSGAGNRIGYRSARRFKGERNKDVTYEEGSNFLKKLKIFLGCMFFSSKQEDSRSDKSRQGKNRHLCSTFLEFHLDSTSTHYFFNLCSSIKLFMTFIISLSFDSLLYK